MAYIRIPAAVDLNIDTFSGVDLTRISSYMQNGLVEKQVGEPDEKLFVTQRPAFNVFVNPDDEPVTDNRGRGIYYWATNSTRYIVNNDTVYRGDYGTIVDTISAGTKKVYFAEVGNLLVVMDPENNEAWTITTGHSLVQIGDAQFPSDIVPGGVSLNDYLYVMDSGGVVYNSNLSDATAWTAADFINAERDNDDGIHLTKQRDHIVALGASTIEFFYDNANPVASPLNRRQDIFHTIGCVDGSTVWTVGDRCVFVGTDAKGGIGVFLMENFQLRKVSNFSLDSFLTDVLTNVDNTAVATGLSAQGKQIYLLTIYTTPADIQSQLTLALDLSSGMWSTWTTGLSVLDADLNFPMMSSTIYYGASPRTMEAITANGCLLELTDNLIPIDTEITSQYVVDGYVVEDYFVESTAGNPANIPLLIRTGHQDGGESRTKFCHSMQFVGDYTDGAETLTVRYADDNHTTYRERTLDTSAKQKVNRLGSFDRRSFEMEYSGDESLRIEGLELHVDIGLG
jgi:hypothetical protein